MNQPTPRGDRLVFRESRDLPATASGRYQARGRRTRDEPSAIYYTIY